MSAYRDFRLTLRLLSPLGSPMQSDTLFGHLCWQVRFAEGGDGVRRFLEPFHAGTPPFVLSDAFPAGLLPRPLLPATGAISSAETKADYAEDKRRRKTQFLVADDFPRVLNGQKPAAEPPDKHWEQIVTPHAAINRNTGTTGGGDDEEERAGNLYETTSWVLAESKKRPKNSDEATTKQSLEIYLRATEKWPEKVEALFQAMSKTGFGGNKSVGLGTFEVEKMEAWDRFNSTAGADAFVSLSSYVPAETDPTDGRGRLRLKHGKLGEQAGGGNPFKRPLLQFEPGAVFSAGGAPRPFYGRLVVGVAPAMPEAVQCGFTLAVPCKWPK